MTARIIHPSALVAPDAELGDGCLVGPFAIVEAGVRVGARSRIDAHAIVRSGTVMGEENHVHPFAVIGDDPQERGYAGEPVRLEIGDGNTFREHVTVHRGSAGGGGVTRIGSGSLVMVGVHVAHDCTIGDRLELANGTLLAGHVSLGDRVVTGGAAAIAPFVRVGQGAFIAGGAMVERDVPPFVIAAGDRARVRALNEVGLRRTGVPEVSQKALARAFTAIFRSGAPRASAAAALVADADPFVRELALFVASVRA